jgi:type IV pilus assembly protein PilB
MSLLITMQDRKLVSILQQNGYINDADLQKSLVRLAEIGGRLSDVLIDTGVVSERKIARAIEDELGVPLVHLSNIEISAELVALLSPAVALEEMAMPFGFDSDTDVLRVAFIDPLNNISVENIEDSTGYTVEKYQALRNEVMWALATYYPALGLEVPQLKANLDLQHNPLGKILVDRGWIKTNHLEEALELQLISGDPLGKIMVEMGVLENAQLYQALAEQNNLEFIAKPQEHKPSEDVTSYLLRGDALRLQCVPIGEVDGKIVIAVSDPKRREDVEKIIGKSVQIVLATPTDIDAAIEQFYPEKGRLGEALIKQGVISRDQLRDAIGIKQKAGGIKPIGEVLIELGFASTEDVEKALLRQRAGGGRLEDTLVQAGTIPPEHLAKSLAFQLSYEYYNPADRPPDPIVQGLIPEGQARRYVVFPVRMEGRSLVVAMKDPRNVFALDDLRVMTGREIIPAVSTEKDVLNLIERNYGNADMSQLNKDLMVQTKGRGMVEEDSTIDTLDDNAVVRVVDSLIREGALADASDIHIEPTAGDTVVRFRIDGDLREHTKLPKSSNTSIMARLKIMGNLDISEKRLPQDGRVRFRKGAIDVDLRLSTLPTVYGEKAVMRILKRATSIPDMEQLGFSDYNFQRLVDTVEKPYGIFLITGPTGSGKSFSTFSILKRLARPDVNVTTIEDPVEYEIPHINQSQVNNQAGMTFARALRSFLRQDPDIIMVGEIRDTEVAQIALEAALTGHLVIATLHTNDAPGAVTRLEEMGIEGFNIAASLIGVMAQRLVKRICKNCKTEVAPDPEVMRRLGMTDDQLEGAIMYRGLGCEKCNGTGYKGRMGIHELMVVEDPVRRAIIAGKSSAEIKDVAVAQGGMLTLRTDGIDKVMQGLTTLEEVLGNTIE